MSVVEVVDLLFILSHSASELDGKCLYLCVVHRLRFRSNHVFGRDGDGGVGACTTIKGLLEISCHYTFRISTLAIFNSYCRQVLPKLAINQMCLSSYYPTFF